MSLANVPETHIDQACVQLAYYIHRRASRNLQRQVPSDEPRVALSVRQSKLLASGWPVDGIRMISYTWGHQRAGMVGRQLLCQRPSKRYIMYDTSSNSLQEGSCAPMCESRSRLTSYRVFHFILSRAWTPGLIVRRYAGACPARRSSVGALRVLATL